ncbi:hypothetical protein M431DRAFT_489032 [Trichoderma harzianum CBS 226.95]|uniref:Uncharacterized protein n=1 Tax=Trichoderma harzianum CBS 226.95 TaxID=983964 RepID=A0A2T4AT83_TRIHA|nr:hypothetical protein M431DRAFT_489032 [Trichoderma harzianum CBS 226.95]PTB60284.1 hypothetical protein M431DRAFT_489032 [Trichoderma harzianum CBS 226.95]
MPCNRIAELVDELLTQVMRQAWTMRDACLIFIRFACRFIIPVLLVKSPSGSRAKSSPQKARIAFMR